MMLRNGKKLQNNCEPKYKSQFIAFKNKFLRKKRAYGSEIIEFFKTIPEFNMYFAPFNYDSYAYRIPLFLFQELTGCTEKDICNLANKIQHYTGCLGIDDIELVRTGFNKYVEFNIFKTPVYNDSDSDDSDSDDSILDNNAELREPVTYTIDDVPKYCSVIRQDTDIKYNIYRELESEQIIKEETYDPTSSYMQYMAIPTYNVYFVTITYDT